MSNKKKDYLDLNQENVLSTYKDCLIPKEDIGKDPTKECATKIFTQETCGKDSPEVVFSREKILSNYYNIKHLLGQLKVAHVDNPFFTLPMGFINFEDKPWTKDNTTLMALYYLGVASRSIPEFSKAPNSDKLFTSAALIIPTYPKNHPNFIPLVDKDAASLDDDQ